MMEAQKGFIRTTGVGLGLVMILAMTAGPLLANCMNQDGTPRDCTASENWGHCVDGARDAYNQCWDGTSNWFVRLGCAAGYDLDIGACHAGFVKDIVLG